MSSLQKHVQSYSWKQHLVSMCHYIKDWTWSFCSQHCDLLVFDQWIQLSLNFRYSDFTCLLRRQGHNVCCGLCLKPTGIRAKFWRVWIMVTLYFISWSERLGILSWSRYSFGLAIGQEGVQRALLVWCKYRVWLHCSALVHRISCLCTDAEK